MNIQDVYIWIEANPGLALLGTVTLSILGYFVARFLIGRGLTYIAARTETRVDDIIVKNLNPFRVAWLAPLIVIYILAYVLPDYRVLIEKTALFLILWAVLFTISSLLNAFNEIYESSQGEIFDHLLAAAPDIDLRVFQEPTERDFTALASQ